MTIHSPQANCLAIVYNFGNFWGDCLNLALFIYKKKSVGNFWGDCLNLALFIYKKKGVC